MQISYRLGGRLKKTVQLQCDEIWRKLATLATF